MFHEAFWIIVSIIKVALILISAATLLTVSAIFILSSLRSTKNYKNIPSFKKRPISAFIRVLKEKSIRAHILRMGQAITKAYEKERIVVIWIGFKPFVNFFRPETIEPLLNSSRTISKADEYRFLQPWLGTGLLTSDGEKWRKHRKLLTPSFHFQILETFMSVINEESNVLIKNMEAEVGKPWIDIVPMITMFTLDTICQTAMGVHLNIQAGGAKDYVERIDQISETFYYRAIRPWLWPDFCFLYCSPSGWRFRENVKHIHDFTRKVIKEKKESILKENSIGERGTLPSGKPKKKAFLELLLQVHLEDSTFTEEDIREEVDTFMFEGHDTTAMSISFTLYLLGRYPKIQEKVYQELDEIFGNDKERDVTSDDLKRMKYLECTVKESLRLYPSVPIIGRKLTETLKVGDYTLESGCTCAVLVYILHLDPEHFPRPEVFDPDRFLPENSNGRHPFAYIPFSAGPRNCIGQRFALMEEKTVLAYILRKFKVTSLDPIDRVETMAGLILKNVKPIRIHLELRENIN